MFRDVLSTARVYSAFKDLIGATAAQQSYVDRHIRPVPGSRILDIGCGPADILDALPDVDYWGLDQSAEYIASARARHGAKGRFEIQTVGADFQYEYSDFDVVLATGVVHHLDDEDALGLFRLAKSALKPHGVLVTLDGAFVEGQPMLARFLARSDRGRYVRSPEEYLRLSKTVFPRVDMHVSTDLLRIPYTHVILRCYNSESAQ